MSIRGATAWALTGSLAIAGVLAGLWLSGFARAAGEDPAAERSSERGAIESGAGGPAPFVWIPEISDEANHQRQALHTLAASREPWTRDDVDMLLAMAEMPLTWYGKPWSEAPQEQRDRFIIIGDVWSAIADRRVQGWPIEPDATELIVARALRMTRDGNPNVRLIAAHAIRLGGFYEREDGRRRLDDMMRSDPEEIVRQAILGNMERYEALKQFAAWGGGAAKGQGGS